MAPSWQDFRENVFGLFYVMTESSHTSRASSWKVLWCGFLYLLDAGQVMKALFIKEFGWTPGVVGLMNNFDFMSFVTNLVPHPYIPPGIFFIAAVALVVLGFMNAALAMHLCQSGRTTRHLWPVKMLRFLVATLVTTFFLTTLRLLLFPLDCSPAPPASAAGGADTLSQWLRGPDAPCTPWASPEAAFTLPAVVLAAAFVLLSLTATLLSFEINPLSEMPGDRSTGRIEALWSTVRVSVVIIKHIHAYITPVAALVLLCLHTALLVAAHVQTLPFHAHGFNLLRGGVYMVVLWAAFASAILSANGHGGSDTAEASMLQWSMIAVAPVLFFAGLVLVEHQRERAHQGIKQLRSEHARDSATAQILGGNMFARRGSVMAGANPLLLQQTNSGGQLVGNHAPMPSRNRRMSLVATGSLRGSGGPAPPAALRTRRRDAYDEFFDFNSRMGRVFDNARAAHAAARILLYQKDQRDLPLLGYILQRAMEEHPDSHDLQILNLIFLRFVFQDKTSAIWQEKITKMVNAEQPLDLKYTLYAVERKVYQLEYGLNLGKDSISAINMIEFSTKIEHVRKQNQECMSVLKRLWKTAAKSKREMSLSTVEDLITQFDNVSHLISHTDKCYVELVDKFSGSASLRRDYAEFCDIVLNDFDKAEMHRHGADLLESGDDIQDAGDESRSRSSSNVSIRSAQRNFIQSWSSSVMGSEVKSLLRLRSLVLGLGFLLFVFSLLGFLIMEVYLYQNVTQIRLDMLQRTKGYRQNLVKSCITLRSLQMEINGTGRASEKIVSQARSSLQSISQSLTSVHTLNYVDAPTETLLRFFVNKNRIKKVPMPGIARVGSFVEQNVSFWDLGINFIDSVALASLIMLSDLGDPDFSVNILSINKRAVVFIFDNIWTLFSTFDVFFDLVLEEIKFVEVIAHTCAACLVTVNIVLIVAIAFFVLQSSRVVFPKCQHGAVGCGLIRALSHTLLRKVYRYYLASEKRRALIEDEDAARQNVIGEDMIEGQENVEDEHYVLPHESLSPEQHLHLNNQAALILHESATEVCKDRRKRKGSISFADTVGEILRLKMQPEVTADHHLISPFHNLQSEAISPLQIACEDICSMEVGGVDEVKDFNVLYPGKNPAILGVCDCSAINANVGHLTAENVRRYLTDRLISNPEPSKATEYASSAVGEIDSTPTPLASHTSQYSFGTCTHQQGPEKVSMSRSSELNQNTGSQEIGQFCFLDQRFQSKQSKVDNKSDSAKDSSAEKIAESNQLASAQNEATEGGTLCLTLVHCQENTLHGRSAWDAAVAWRILYRRLVYRYTDSDSEGLLHYFDHNESCNDELSHNLVLEGEIKDDDRLCHRHVCSVPEKNGLLASIESKRGSENTGDDDIFVNIPLSDLSEAGSPPGKTKRTGPFLHQHPAAQASSSKGPNNHGQSRQLGDSSRSLTAYAVEAISMAASSGLRRMHSILKSSVADVHHPILKHKPSPINASAEATIQYEPTMQEDEVEDEITVYVVQATVSRMKWYFRSEFHGTALLLVLIVCLCAWLLPLRILPDLVNIAVLSRQARDAGGGVLQCVFFARELVLHDGFSRLSPQQLAQKLRGSCTDLQRSVKRLRLGGDGVVHFGADTLVSPTMDKYQAVMYQPGCPWRVNSSDCSLVSRPQASSQGLYKLLVAFVQSVEVILTKFNATSEATEPSYDHVITNSTLKKVLYEDPDIKFLLENASQDSTDGLALVSKILMEEQARLFSELHQENQTIFLIFLLSVIVVFYFVLIRTTMAAAIHEVERTRAFVNRIPVHIIAREEVLDIRNYFDKDWMHEHEEDNNTGMNTLSRAGSFLDYKE